MPLQFNSVILKFVIIILHSPQPYHFIRLSRCLGPPSDRIRVRISCMDKNIAAPAASLPPLNDVWASLVKFFFNLQLFLQPPVVFLLQTPLHPPTIEGSAGDGCTPARVPRGGGGSCLSSLLGWAVASPSSSLCLRVKGRRRGQFASSAALLSPPAFSSLRPSSALSALRASYR